MTYKQLKDLPPKDLIQELLRTLIMWRDITAVPEFQHKSPNALPPPVLCLLGDFEIRARFYDVASDELDPGDKCDCFGNIK